MNVIAGLYIGAWILIWDGIFMFIKLTFRGSAASQALGALTS